MDNAAQAPALSRSERWEFLKPYLEHLWLDTKLKLAEIVEHMKVNHQHFANEREYRSKFKDWKWKRNMSRKIMSKVVDEYETRAIAGKSGSVATLAGRVIEPKKIRRFIKDKIRADAQDVKFCQIQRLPPGSVVPFTNSFFLKWNMPYEALISSRTGAFNHASPQAFSTVSPASDLIVATPSSHASPHNMPSPTAIVLKSKTIAERTQLFIQGRHDTLLADMNKAERRTMSDWLYQFWFFGFKTTKHWGKGPLHWTHGRLGFEQFYPRKHKSLPVTPQNASETSEEHANDRLAPGQCCNWLIHVRRQHYERSFDDSDVFGGDSPSEQWSEEQLREPLAARLRDALAHNDFCPDPNVQLPVAIPKIAAAAQRSPDELLVEALAFCIMSRNQEQASEVADQIFEQKINLQPMYPLHLATSYLDGHKSCCNMLKGLILDMDGSLSDFWSNEYGHSLLDNLMISILKSHSTAAPGLVDDKFRTMTRFVGEEVDICGRWDADSPCVRHLFAKGEASIPSDWKHKFCHTSVQTIVHCIEILMKRAPERLLTTERSGLYLRHCFGCGTTLSLQPLHCLVVTTFNLARYAAGADEDLFGMLACLLCMLSHGLDPRAKGEIGVHLLLGEDTTQELCDHDNLTAADLAYRLSDSAIIGDWNMRLQTGWSVFRGVLRLSEEHYELNKGDQEEDDFEENDEENDEEYDEDEDDLEFIPRADLVSHLRYQHFDIHLMNMSQFHRFRNRKDLATLWASAQAEILSYRRLNEEMDWISPNFSMEDLSLQLLTNDTLAVKFASEGLLNTHCICGKFEGHPITMLDEATDPDIANLDVWDRATYTLLEGDE